jgi:general secretion pathway protein I
MNRRSQIGGFTLIETLVAFTIAATALALLFRINAGSNATATLADEYVQATALARSLLAEHGVTESALLFSRNATERGKYRWRIRAEPLRDLVTPQDGIPAPFALRLLTAEVEWDSRDRVRVVQLRTAGPVFPERGP